MDPPPDPTLLPPPVSVASAAPAAVNPSLANLPPQDHPPYSEMITAAISALNDRNGSSKRAISKYIESHFPNLPLSHPGHLTHNLQRLKATGQLIMVKQSYKLPGSDPVPAAINGVVPSDPASAVPKRRPGRPPKSKHDSVQPPVPVFAPSVDMNSVPAPVPPSVDIGQESVHLVSAQVNGPPAPPVRGRGRPPKRAKRGPGRPPKVAGVTGARGRPKKSAILAARKKVLGRPRGRPPKHGNVVQGLAPGVPHGVGVEAAPVALGGGVAAVGGKKRRGRPPKADAVVKKAKSFSPTGKPVGRPRKDQLKSSDSQLLVAYLDLKTKLENLQSRIQATVTFVKPSVNNEAAFNALQDLEQVAISIGAPLNAENHHHQQPPMPEQQPIPPPGPPPFP